MMGLVGFEFMMEKHPAINRHTEILAGDTG
jgi:hypothetical protein